MEFPDITKASIVVIDDDDAIGAGIRAGLELPKIELDINCASSGVAGLQMVKKLRPDIAILDLQLPDIDGFEVLNEIRQDPQLAHTRVIMLTAKDTSDNLWKGIDRHLDDFIGKPFDLEELEARIYNQLLMKNENKH